jgi:bifunctional non-homologous end joining protein LigD
MPRKAKTDEPLAEYARKRDFTATPEPKGSKRNASTALRFVVQKHRATRLHYDFRLEAGGVLASWAVPKGPSLDTHERRLAMHVEDHPYDYRAFEGIIPVGNYGAGEVIVWDEGTYTLVEGTDPVHEIAGGKIKFIMHGKKLRGMFTLVKIKSHTGEDGDPWLLIKDHDEFVDPSYDVKDHPESAKTGKTLEDIAGSKTAKTWKSNRSAAEPAAKKPRAPAKRAKAEPIPKGFTPMLATLADAPFDDNAWLFEVKWDGFRAIATIDANGKVALTSRNGLDLLKRFQDLEGIGAAFRSLPVVVDGEICALDAQGRSSFQALQQVEIAARGKNRTRLTFIAFDLIYADGRDLRTLPLEERKAKLESLIVDGHDVLYSKHIIGRGTEFFALAKQERLEGIIGKRRDSVYRSTRSRDWFKIKAKHEEEFVIGGWTEPKGSRSDFGALLLGQYEGHELVFSGQVGTGFNQKVLREVGAALKKRERKTSPFKDVPRMKPAPHFVKPDLVAQIAFAEWTSDGLLRQPVFLGLRIDKAAADVTRERAKPSLRRA